MRRATAVWRVPSAGPCERPPHDAVEEIKAEEQGLRDAILKLTKGPRASRRHRDGPEATTVFENRPDLLENAERFREVLGDS